MVSNEMPTEREVRPQSRHGLPAGLRVLRDRLSVTVRARQRAFAVLWLAAALTASGVQATDDRQSIVTFAFALPAGVGELPAGSRLLVLGHGTDSPAIERSLDARPVPISVELPPAPAWTIHLKSPGLWAPDHTLISDPSTPTHSVRLQIWRAARITGTLRSRSTESSVADALDAHLTLPEGSLPDGAGLRSSISCPIEDNHFQCIVPAAHFDLRLSLEGRVPRYIWGLEPNATKPHHLGQLEFPRGASLVGRVEATVGALEPEKTAVKLTPRQAPGGDPRTAERLRQTAETAPVDTGGFFQLGGLRTGAYTLEARHPGYAPSRVAVEIYEDIETRLPDPIQLRLPLDLQLRVEPSLDWQQRPWHVEIRRLAAGSASYENKAVYEGVALADGTLEVPGQPPGRYALSIRDTAGNVFWSERDRVIETQSDAQVEVEVEMIAIEGRLLLKDEPVEARLWFGGRSDVLRSVFTSNADGEFLGVLPRAGTWRVEVAAREPRLHTFLRVRVPEKGSDPRQVRIEIPDTLLSGSVINATGEPVGRAMVSVEASGDSIDTISDERGRFEVRGMPEGRLRLMAMADRAGERQSSRPHEAYAYESRPAGPVVLQLEEREPITGRVLSTRGPVPGALVSVLPPAAVGGFGDSARTDLEGRFRVRLPKTLQRLHVTVLPPGHALKTFEIDLSYGRAIVLQVPSLGGDLRIEPPMDQESFLAQHRGLRIEAEGIPLSTSALYRWATSHGGRFGWAEISVPQLAAGHYRVCLYDPVQSGSGSLAGERCDDGYLAEGGELSLAVRSREEAED